MEYTLKRSKRKTLSLSVTPELTVLVRAPLRLGKAEIDGFVQAHSQWIAQQQEKQRHYQQANPPLAEDELLRLKQLAQEYIPKRVAHFVEKMGLVPTGVKITRAKTRWGSCSGKNSLCFSCRLMRCPAAAIDYVVVHELAHIRHKNHGAEFYALIASILPDYKERRALLRPQ